jgi:hypothetical protein
MAFAAKNTQIMCLIAVIYQAVFTIDMAAVGFYMFERFRLAYSCRKPVALYVLY